MYNRSVLFIGFNMTCLTAVCTLASGASGLLGWSWRSAWGTGIPLCGSREDALLFLSGLTALFVAFQAA